MGEKNPKTGSAAPEINHPTLGRLNLGGEVAKIRLEHGDRKSANTVIRKFGPALAAEAMLFISENLNNSDDAMVKEAVGLLKSMMPYAASKAPSISIQKNEDGGEIKTEVKEALMEVLGDRLQEADYEVEE